MSNLATHLERNVQDDTCVIVASSPGSKMAEVPPPRRPKSAQPLLRARPPLSTVFRQVEPIIAEFKKTHKALKANVHLGYCQKEGYNRFT